MLDLQGDFHAPEVTPDRPGRRSKGTDSGTDGYVLLSQEDAALLPLLSAEEAEVRGVGGAIGVPAHALHVSPGLVASIASGHRHTH